MKEREMECLEMVEECIKTDCSEEFLNWLKTTAEAELLRQLKIRFNKLENDLKLIKDELGLLE